ncbi:MAG: hypothetical protein JXA89_27630 [Anaerolineae bacterium]|nr:hypothetical protein [Anaerolineae bacterium]
MENWRKQFKFDPLPPLLSCGDQALAYWVRRDLLEENVGPVQCLWTLPEALKILKKQLPDGSWPRVGAEKHPAVNYPLIETWRQFRYLVEQYGFTREHPQAQKAVGLLFSCQTQEGDIRGFLANQYATYYTGAIMSLLIQAGYADDSRIERGFQWLLAMRQDDQGWTIPILTHKLDRATQYRLTSEYAEPLEPDRSKSFSHNWTGMVLRAFAVHPHYCHSQAARVAAHLLKSRFFQPDCYTSYQAASYWVRFDYPFWWNNLVTALDSLSLMGFSGHDEQIELALKWLVDHQEESGLWQVSYAKPYEEREATAQVRKTQFWVSLAICRVFKRLFE